MSDIDVDYEKLFFFRFIDEIFGEKIRVSFVI